MELSTEIRWPEIQHLVVVSALVVLLVFNGAGDSPVFADNAASAPNDPYITVMVRTAEFVFVGSVVRLLQSDCALSGLATSHQGIVFEVRRVLKGDSKIRGEVTAYYIVVGDPRREVLLDACNQLTPEVFQAGREFIVACVRDSNLVPGGGWEIIEGPWLSDMDAERIVVDAIAKGDVGLAQEVWLKAEINVEHFIQGQDVPDEKVLRAIRLFDELTGSQSSQGDKNIASICRSALQIDLDSWKEWYGKYHHCLVWDKNRLNVRVDEPCIAGKGE